VYLGGEAVPGLTSHSGDISYGLNPDGSQRYLRLGKYATDAFMMFIHPETIFSKMSAPARALFDMGTIALGHEPGTGERLQPGQGLPEAGAAAIRPFTPFSVEGVVQQIEHAASPRVFPEPSATTQFMGMPAKRGASFSQSVDALRQAIDSGDDKLVEQVVNNAALNGYKLRSLEAEMKKENRRGDRRAAGIQPTAPPPAPPK
jgi:hypothetical protein